MTLEGSLRISQAARAVEESTNPLDRIYRNATFVTFRPDHNNAGTGKQLDAFISQDGWTGVPALVVVMRDTNEFFEGKAQECTALANAARNKTDREFWLRLARRWEEMQQPRRRKRTQAEGPVRRKYGLSRFTKWHISAGY